MPESSWGAGYNYYGSGSDPYSELSQKIDSLSKFMRGAEVKAGGPVPRSSTGIARREIADIFKQKQATQGQLGNIWQTYLNRIKRGSMDPGEAELAYMDIARSSGAKLGESFKKASELGATPMGFAPAEQYDRYKPAASLAFSQLLGRPLGEQEFKNYVSAAQGLGISKGPDFQAFLGETLLSSPEYKSQAVIFDPNRVAAGVQALSASRPKTSLQDYAAMLSAL